MRRGKSLVYDRSASAELTFHENIDLITLLVLDAPWSVEKIACDEAKASSTMGLPGVMGDVDIWAPTIFLAIVGVLFNRDKEPRVPFIRHLE